MKRVDRVVVRVALGAAAGVCFLLSGAVANAAEPSVPTPPPAPQVRPLDLGPMIRPTDDPAKVEAAKQFIMLYHPQTDPVNINRMLNSYVERELATAKKKDPNLDVAKFDHDKRQHFLDNGAKSLNNQAHVVSRHFTLEEFKDLSAFFGSTLGRKLTEESPRITQEMRQARREEVKQELAARKARGDDDDDDDDDEDDVKKPAPRKPPAKPVAKPPVTQHK